MLDFLEKAMKDMAKNSAGTMMAVSMSKDWLLLKSGTQININIINGTRKLALQNAQRKVLKGIKGKSGEKIIREISKVDAYGYYNKGADSIRW